MKSNSKTTMNYYISKNCTTLEVWSHHKKTCEHVESCIKIDFNLFKLKAHIHIRFNFIKKSKVGTEV